MKDTINEAVVKAMALQLLEGIQILHEEGFMYRDLKPEARLLQLFNVAVC
jgi:serine/threonine protein kinase